MKWNRITGISLIAMIWLLATGLQGCGPTVKLETPEKPLEINMTITIDHNIKVQLEEEIEAVLAEEGNEEIF